LASLAIQPSGLVAMMEVSNPAVRPALAEGGC